ncbi:MAG: hypothetical protein M0P39_02865 [Rhodocyclaceae bacterium]|jgi:hypothetical protein|nr:hypothetical protein [Rhodocyclaceae bacterium]
MKRLPRPFVALIAALLLVLAQQGALAHMIGHAGATAQSSLQQDESGHDAALSLSHVCTTCIAFTALGGAVPMAAYTWFIDAQIVVRQAKQPLPLAGRRLLSARARAPPIFL